VLVTVYPIVMNVQGRLAVVVGGGTVAERKVAALLEAGAAVRVVSPELVPALEHLRDRGQITWEARRFEAATLEGATLAFAATDDDTVNAAVVTAARKRSILVNDAGKAERGDFATHARQHARLRVSRQRARDDANADGYGEARTQRRRIDRHQYLDQRR
jgi:siroheme synthase-like protein